MNKSILASSQWLDGKIQGKSVKYNQLVQNGNFEGTINWIVTNPDKATVTTSNNVITFEITNVASHWSNGTYLIQGSKHYVENHKYLTMCEVYADVAGNVAFYFGSAYDEYININANKWEKVATFRTQATTVTTTIQMTPFFISSMAVGNIYKQRNFVQVDLTDIYGAGSEPTTLAEFYNTELGKLVQAGKYLPYGSGILNATAPFVFKDANDNTLATYSRTSKVDLGSLYWGYNSESGHERFYTTDLVSIVKKPQTNNDTANCYCPIYKTLSATLGYAYGTSLISLFVYNTGRLQISNSNYTDAQSFKSAMSGIYLEYEPATQLELRSAGTIKDTLSNCDGKVVRNVGTRAYQSGDENNPNYLTDGTTTNYPLATPTTEQHASLAIPKLATKCTDANGMEIDIERNN